LIVFKRLLDPLEQLYLKKIGGDQWRRQDLVSGGHDDRGAEGASIEAPAPKVPSGVGYGKGCALPSRLGGLGEHRELPQRGPGGAPVTITFSAYFRPQNASGSKFHFEKVVVTVTTTF